jgi:hypothetical protein
MANAPLPGRDGGSYAADLGGDGKRNIFVGGLDRANHVELVQKNRAAAHPNVIDNLRHHWP